MQPHARLDPNTLRTGDHDKTALRLEPITCYEQAITTRTTMMMTSMPMTMMMTTMAMTTMMTVMAMI